MIRVIFALCALFALAAPARAETVEVAPGVRVTKTTFDAPINEQPFFGFAPKTESQREVDAKFIADIIAAAGTREKAFEATVQRGWASLDKKSFGEAAKRFNQAYLLDPQASAIYHGFAMIAAARFNDLAFADELFKVAQKQPYPNKALNADYGRLLIIAKRPDEARVVLEKAATDTPDLADAWANLAFARLQTGDAKSACAAASEADKRRPSLNVMADINLLRRQASCS
jgi:Tfp pilus assembly protein PilF